jgi:hypothetical protein
LLLQWQKSRLKQRVMMAFHNLPHPADAGAADVSSVSKSAKTQTKVRIVAMKEERQPHSTFTSIALMQPAKMRRNATALLLKDIVT